MSIRGLLTVSIQGLLFEKEQKKDTNSIDPGVTLQQTVEKVNKKVNSKTKTLSVLKKVLTVVLTTHSITD